MTRDGLTEENLRDGSVKDMKAVSSEEEETDENAGVESARPVSYTHLSTPQSASGNNGRNVTL